MFPEYDYFQGKEYTESTKEMFNHNKIVLNGFKYRNGKNLHLD